MSGTLKKRNHCLKAIGSPGSKWTTWSDFKRMEYTPAASEKRFKAVAVYAKPGKLMAGFAFRLGGLNTWLSIKFCLVWLSSFEDEGKVNRAKQEKKLLRSNAENCAKWRSLHSNTSFLTEWRFFKLTDASLSKYYRFFGRMDSNFTYIQTKKTFSYEKETNQETGH